MIKALFENYSEVGWAGIVMIAMVWIFIIRLNVKVKEMKNTMQSKKKKGNLVEE